MNKNKFDKEIAEFRKSYEHKTPIQVYNDYYIISFMENYYTMIISDGFINWDDYNYLLEWLLQFENPLHFLYDEWLKADGAFDQDWDSMFDFILQIYEDCSKNN